MSARVVKTDYGSPYRRHREHRAKKNRKKWHKYRRAYVIQREDQIARIEKEEILQELKIYGIQKK